MSNMQATLRALLGRLSSLCELAAQASELLFATTAANKYVTAALLELTPSSGAARYVSAGHTDCLLLRASGEEVWLKSTGAPLGLLVGVPYTDTTFVFGAGDCLALFSDGVTEAQNEAGEDFGEARLCDIVRSSAGESADVVVARIFDAIDRFAGTAPQFDDITVMVLKKLTFRRSSQTPTSSRARRCPAPSPVPGRDRLDPVAMSAGSLVEEIFSPSSPTATSASPCRSTGACSRPCRF
jgi:sigma-B regulation protein RsbU (phosphoserine phosphatase)